MKKILFFVVFSSALVTCSEKKEINLTKEVHTQHCVDPETGFVLDNIAKIPDSLKMAYLGQQWPLFRSDIVAWTQKSSEKIDSLVLYVGTGHGNVITNSHEVHGVFTNEVVVVLKHRAVSDTFFVRSSNRLTKVDTTSEFKKIGVINEKEFIVERNTDFIERFGLHKAIQLAYRLNIPVAEKFTEKKDTIYVVQKKIKKKIHIKNRCGCPETKTIFVSIKPKMSITSKKRLVSAVISLAPGDYFKFPNMYISVQHRVKIPYSPCL